MYEYSKKSLEERLKLLDMAHPSISSQLQRTLGKSVLSVEKQTTQCKITGLGEESKSKKGQGTKIPKIVEFIRKKEDGQKGEGQRKGTNECQCIICTRIDFSCYEMGEEVEWFLDSGCTDHMTPRKSDFVQYTELGQASKAEIADGKYLTIEGYGTIIGHSIMLNQLASFQIQNVLYIPQTNKWLFLLIATGQ